MLLMTPGPIAVDQRVLAAINRPAITPEHASFMTVLDDVFQKLKAIFQTESWVTLFPGSGRIGLEASMVSVLEPGDSSVHVVNGAFGDLAVDIAQRAGAEAIKVEGRWGGRIDLHVVEQTIRRVRPKLVTVVHCETSTGALYDLFEIGRICHEHDALLMVDAISSVVNMPLEMDRMGCDLAVGASNKGFGSLHGLAMVGVSPRALQRLNERKTNCSSWSLDLKRWSDMYFGKSTGRRSATPPPTHLVYALQEACRLLLEEGLETHWSRCQRFARATRRAIQAAGLGIFPDPNLLSNCVTAIRLPENVESSSIVREMEARGILVAGTVARPSPISGRLIRISHQGMQASAEMLVPTLSALEGTLRHMGHSIKYGTMVAAFEACVEETSV